MLLYPSMAGAFCEFYTKCFKKFQLAFLQFLVIFVLLFNIVSEKTNLMAPNEQ